MVACDAATHHRGVGREERCHIGGVRAQVERTGGRHPFVEVGSDLVLCRAEGIDIRSDHLTGSPTEEHRLNIVPLTRDRVYVVLIPQRLKNLVLLGEERGEVDQNSHRVTLNLPTAYADTDTLLIDTLTPSAQQRGILLELGICTLILQIGTDQHIVVIEFAQRGFGFGCNDGMDTANFVAYLPAHLKQMVGSHFRVAHYLLVNC